MSSSQPAVHTSRGTVSEPLRIGAAITAAAVTLALMHVAVGAAWLTAIRPRPTTR